MTYSIEPACHQEPITAEDQMRDTHVCGDGAGYCPMCWPVNPIYNLKPAPKLNDKQQLEGQGISRPRVETPPTAGV